MPYKNDLTNSLIEVIKDKKTLMLIDGANLYFAAHSKRWNIDFAQLFSWFSSHTNLVESIYYTAFNPEDVKQNEFIAGLTVSGFNVFKKPIKTFSDSSIKGNLDVEICVDTMKHIFNFQTLVLISGDGDFTYLAQTLESMGKKVIVIGVGGFMSYELQEQADNYFLLDRIKSVWQKQKQLKLDADGNPIVAATKAAKPRSNNVKNSPLKPNSNETLANSSPQPKIKDVAPKPAKTSNSIDKSKPQVNTVAPKPTKNPNFNTKSKPQTSPNNQIKQISLDGLNVENKSKQNPNSNSNKQKRDIPNRQKPVQNQQPNSNLPEIFL